MELLGRMAAADEGRSEAQRILLIGIAAQCAHQWEIGRQRGPQGWIDLLCATAIQPLLQEP
jgi:hypothetical protein